MIVGSISSEVYRRIQAYVRKGASASDPSQPDSAMSPPTKPESEQNMNVSAAGPISPGPSRAGLATPTIGKPDTAATRETLRVGARVLAAYWNEKREFEGFWVATVKRIEPREYTLEWFDGPEYPPFESRPQVPRLRQVTRNSVLGNSMGRPAGSPLFIPRIP
jgi:hypothetical protein